MDWSGTRVLFAVLVALRLSRAAPAAAESSSAMTCNVEHLSDGSFMYQLSQPPSAPICETCWEDVERKNYVIARDSEFDPDLTVNLTNQFIILKNCSDHLHYTRECSGVYEDAHCRVNCSSFVKTPPTVNSSLSSINSTLICIKEGLCLRQMTFGLSITGILVLVAAVAGCLFIRPKCRRMTSRRGQQSVNKTVLYTSANCQIETLERKATDVV